MVLVEDYKPISNANPTLQGNSFNERRSGLRFKVRGPDTSVSFSINDTNYKAHLKNIGLSGCMIVLDRSTYDAQKENLISARKNTVEIKLLFDNYDNSKPACYIANVVDIEDEPSVSLGVYFKFPITIWSLPEISSKLSLETNYHSRTNLFHRQKELALSDMSSLQQEVNALKSQQFKMIMAGIPIFAGLITSSLTVAIQNEPVVWWNIFLPPMILFMSAAMLAIFLEKNSFIRKRDAFCHTLQTHLSLGCFPYFYRGWRDAYANYNHLMRYGGAKKYQIPELRKVTTADLTAMPTDKFSVIAVLILMSFPMLAGAETVYLVSEKLQFQNWVNVIIGASIFAILVPTYRYFYSDFRKSRVGEDSYRALLIRFDKILHYAPPFDPCSDKELG